MYSRPRFPRKYFGALQEPDGPSRGAAQNGRRNDQEVQGLLRATAKADRRNPLQLKHDLSPLTYGVRIYNLSIGSEIICEGSLFSDLSLLPETDCRK